MRHTYIFTATLGIVLGIAAPALADLAKKAEGCTNVINPYLGIKNCTELLFEITQLNNGSERLSSDLNNLLLNIYTVRAVQYSAIQDYHLAIEDFDEALRLMPKEKDIAEIYAGRGISYHYIGNFQQAIRDLDEALRLNPGYALGYILRGVVYNDIGDYAQGVRDWEHAMQLARAPLIIFYQGMMKKRGHYSGPIDGIYGPSTRRALIACASDPACK